MLPNLPDVEYFSAFFDKTLAEYYYDKLLSELSFESETYTFSSSDGKTVTELQTKRKMSYHSEKSYSYSKQVYDGKPWTPTLVDLRDVIEKATGYQFNAVLCNYYENGEAGMGWHADKEKELGNTPTIASLSFGEERRFAFRHRKDVLGVKNPPRLCEYALKTGDLLIMKGQTQQYFEHCVVKDKSAKGARINLTFRLIV